MSLQGYVDAEALPKEASPESNPQAHLLDHCGTPSNRQ